MNLAPVKTPRSVKALFPNYVWDIKTNQKEIYLTFDDGPTPKITPWVLQQLKKYNAKATFFCIGNNVEKYPEIFSQILKEEHAIGNHTFNHLKGWKVKTSDYIEDVLQCNSTFISSVSTKLFRPPYGKLKPKQTKQLKEKGYKIIMWDILSLDWDKQVTPEKCLNNVLKHSTKGSIIVFHDSIKAEKNMKFALPKVLKHFSNKGFAFKAIET